MDMWCFFLLIIISWALLFYGVSALGWLVVFSAFFGFLYSLDYFSLESVSVLLGLFLLIYSILGVGFIRRVLLTSSLVKRFKGRLPRISNTEAQAIEAGDVWLDGDIFSTKLDWKKIDNHKLTELNPDEVLFLNNQVDVLCSLLNDWDVITKDVDLSKEAWEYIKDNKFLALNIAKKYGGLEFSATAQSCVVTKIATRSIAAAVTIMVPNALGPGELLTHYGTDSQKDYYLPRLARGEEIPCFALTSPYAGSDAGGMLDNGVICKQEYNGKEELGIRLNFSKRYITLAPVATVMGLAFKLYDPDKLYSDKVDLGITLALIPTNHPGISIGRRHLAVMVPFQNGPISGKDVFIPMSFIIGGNDFIGRGWLMLMECLSGGRGVSLPALSTATTQLSFLSSTIYSSLRFQFKVAISFLEGIQEQLAKIAGFNFITNAMRVMTTSALDQKLKPAVISGISKYHMTEFARDAINRAMDIHGGKGVMNGPDNYLISSYFGSPIAITVEGANILTRNLIIFGQGAFRAHPYVLQEIKALTMENRRDALHAFDNVVYKHVNFFMRNSARLLCYGIQKKFSKHYYKKFHKNDFLAPYRKDLTRMSTALALATDTALLVIGGDLKFKERLSARLGDVLSYIYMAICVIKFRSELIKPEQKNLLDKYELEYYIENVDFHTKWCLDYCLSMAQNALLDFISNFPVQGASKFLKFMIFPFAPNYKKPSDLDDMQLAILSTVPNTLFNRLSDLVYLNNGDQHTSSLGVLKNVFLKKIELGDQLADLFDLVASGDIKYSNDLKMMVNEANSKDLLTEEDYTKLLDFATSLDKIINVNDFDPELFK